MSKSSNFNTKGNSCPERSKNSLVRVRVKVLLGLVIGHIAIVLAISFWERSSFVL